LIKSGVSNYDVIREMFLLRSIHLYGVLGVAVGLTFAAYFIIKILKVKSLIKKEVIDMSVEPFGKKHIIGGLLAGSGWALTGACPGPALALIGFGTLPGIFIALGIFAGVYVFGRRNSP